MERLIFKMVEQAHLNVDGKLPGEEKLRFAFGMKFRYIYSSRSFSLSLSLSLVYGISSLRKLKDLGHREQKEELALDAYSVIMTGRIGEWV